MLPLQVVPAESPWK